MSNPPAAITPSEAPPAPSVARPPSGEKFFDWLFRAFQRAFIDGPDPVAPDDPESLGEVLLPWPVRLAGVVAVVWAASFWRTAGVGQQLAWGLQVGGFCLTSIISEFWWVFLAVDCLLALAWLVPFEASDEAPRRREFLQGITFVNRQVEHVKALVVWLLVAFTGSSVLTWQAGITAGTLLLGMPLINGLARLPLGFLGHEATSKRSGGLYWRRRILIYFVTLVGLFALAMRAWGQIRQVVPLLFAFAAGLVLRIVRHELRGRRVKSELARNDTATLGAREQFRRQQAETAHHADGVGPALVLAGMAALVVLSSVERQKLDGELAPPGPAKNAAKGPPKNACPPPESPGAPAAIALFVLADTQTHELSGAPFPGQTELANVFARTATRPVALDMLSGIVVQHFQRAYAALAAARNEKQLSPPYWAHLGDMADIGCQKELERMVALLTPFSAVGPLASVAVGNHEKNFEGSFHWSPYWDTACRSKRMSPDDATATLQAKFGALLPKGGRLLRDEAATFNPSGGTLASVVPLGTSRHAGKPRGVVGIFLDTSDGRALDYGNPGSFGALSQPQLNEVEAAVEQLRKTGGYADPAYVLFEHVPFDALAGASQQRFVEFVEKLGAANVLSLFTAHTHAAATKNHCVGKRPLNLHEVTVGSTVDPPEQAAIVEIGPDAQGRLTLSSRTLASVARPEFACGDAPFAVPARECRAVAARLSKLDECRALLAPDTKSAPYRDCQDLEQAGTFSLRLAAIRKYQGPLDEHERRELDEARAHELLQCVCHGDQACHPAEKPLADDSYLSILAREAADPARQTELTCLTWAASAMQAHKDADMTMAEAMRCSFDDPTFPAEERSSVTLGATPCE
ncbi:MAG TPA: hypothetical protein VGQ57_20660 [Polyangiaceae bacterium]|jgi:hypothetical protein|nr:hypothetical protein [Polyangiaceae bacterium]